MRMQCPCALHSTHLAFAANKSFRSMPGPRGRAPTSKAKSTLSKALSESVKHRTPGEVQHISR